MTDQDKLLSKRIYLSESWESVLDVLDIEGSVVDNGIGPYECHGFKGWHSKIEFEVKHPEFDVEVHWMESDPFHDDNQSFSVTTTVTTLMRGARSDEDTEDYEVGVSGTATSFSAKLRSVDCDGVIVNYWECSATYYIKIGEA